MTLSIPRNPPSDRIPARRDLGKDCHRAVDVIEEEEPLEACGFRCTDCAHKGCDALCLRGLPVNARHSVAIGVEVDYSELVVAPQADGGGNVEIASDVAAHVVAAVLIFVDFHKDVAPRHSNCEVHVCPASFGAQATSSEGDVLLVLERKARLLQILVNFELLPLGRSLAVAGMRPSHVHD